MAEIANIGSRSPAKREDQAATTTSRKMLPAMDIWEDADAITLLADMPGVGKDDLSVELADHTLTLGGHIDIELPKQLTARYAEQQVSSYERQLKLGEGIDTEKIEATVKDGVVTVRLPKSAATRRRRIEIKSH